YVGEISKRQLQSDEEKYYRQGDIVGISGIEQRYEKFLRGKRGVSYKIVNVRGSVQGQFRDGAFDSIPVPGDQLQLTIDLPLQQYAERLMEGKIGSVVALDPRTGEILAFVSAPSYDPNLFSGRLFSENYGDIQKDSLKPLFNRPLQAMYPPGSMFKPVQALIAMQEKRLSAKEEIFCDGSLIGDLAPPGKYDVVKAITWSSNNYFVKIFRRVIQQGENPSPFIDSRIGMEKWVNYLENFGLGSPLGIDLANEKGGLIPGISVYDKIYGRNRWKFSNIYSLSIGQGEILVTPLQMANLGAIFANKGYYFTPHLVKSIGDSLLAYSQQDVGIESHHYEPVINGLEQVVIAGSARRAYIPDLQICGKTSTVQNPHGEDHSGFMGFAPLEDPQIAVAVYVENAGWGGRAAASTASLLIEKYVRGHITRSWIENYVLKGDFADEKRTAVESN
ncbi:MAG: peptidoglycan glycosyltransferase, partial [Cyclobacteriaceae bacterium]|nr:peptidoglycan glycosyltransferase [Cyclobacteriaceae bacterium HetDA_MAG_MS6]